MTTALKVNDHNISRDLYYTLPIIVFMYLFDRRWISLEILLRSYQVSGGPCIHLKVAEPFEWWVLPLH